MRTSNHLTIRWPVALAAGVLMAVLPSPAPAKVQGLTGTAFTLTAKADTISTSDGDSVWTWGFAAGTGRMQYPGPILDVVQGATITITLNNQLPVPVSIVFPGQVVTSSGGTLGLLAREAPAADPGQTTGPVTYRFTASQPGTYIYYSGTRPDLEVEMGLVGAIVVRPKVGATVYQNRAYADVSTEFEQEYMFVLSDLDPVIHSAVALKCITRAACDLSQVDTTQRHATDWFINGRNFPDTMAEANHPMFPTQPFDSMAVAHAGDRVLMRLVGGGLDLHPFHTHGQNHLVIARDGRLLKTAASASPDLAVSDYTTTSVPGETVDAIWGPWTGAKLGWDAYGTNAIHPHTCSNGPGGFDPATHEYCPDHNRAIPVALPSDSELTYGSAGAAGSWGGSPFLGLTGDLPPQNPGSFAQGNSMGAFTFMWHSHNERELTTNNIFPGGMATMIMVVPAGMPIP